MHHRSLEAGSLRVSFSFDTCTLRHVQHVFVYVGGKIWQRIRTEALSRRSVQILMHWPTCCCTPILQALGLLGLSHWQHSLLSIESAFLNWRKIARCLFVSIVCFLFLFVCLFFFGLFCFVLFCCVLFCFVLFCLFCFVLFCFVQFCFVLFCFVCLFVLLCFVLFCFVLV